ncbi:hypothetical protein [Telmatospirillum siberiense]|uniref:ACT domain-containing protein n=1 Tax=Telmatospirillum siberiense TaxID=382514 RepID=A0A2N3PYN4_9PROT|nr:hypothetical protein [Telmatospirillum siberiense]PKU25485.1 hypothetical protein CWS72_05300 [Telmatospirillum siberiense]
MNAALPPTLTTHLVSVVADADPGLLARLSGVLARLEILPLQIYSRLHQDAERRGGQADDNSAHLEIDLYLSAASAGNKDRLVALLRAMVGVESVATSA